MVGTWWYAVLKQMAMLLHFLSCNRNINIRLTTAFTFVPNLCHTPVIVISLFLVKHLSVLKVMNSVTVKELKVEAVVWQTGS